ENMYMTSFLQALIEKYNNAKAVEIDGNWCEIDFMSDLEVQIDK
ncbi:sugar nucleotidyltransferase, partial [Campylobacter jejuni]